jgi:hypothetical protein
VSRSYAFFAKLIDGPSIMSNDAVRNIAVTAAKMIANSHLFPKNIFGAYALYTKRTINLTDQYTRAMFKIR